MFSENSRNNLISTEYLPVLSVGVGQGTAHTGTGATPAIYFRASDKSLRVSSVVNGNPINSYITANGVDSHHQWSNIEVSQWQNDFGEYIYSVKINGVTNVASSVINTDPQEFDNVYIYAAKDGSQPALCWIRDFQFETRESLPPGTIPKEQVIFDPF